MKLIDNLIDRFSNRKEIEEIESKLIEQGNIIEKTASDILLGVENGSYVEWNINTSTKNPFSKHYTIYRGVTLSANNISSVPMELYRGENLLQPDFILPGGFNFQQPNPQQSLKELLYQGLVYLFYRGELFYHIISKSEDNPFFSLEVLDPNLMVKQKDGSWRWNNRIVITNEQLIYTKIFNPDSDRGLSPFEVIKEGLQSDLSAEEYNAKYFKNAGTIGGTLSDTKGTASDKQMETATKQFNQLHGGSKNAHKTAGLPAGIKYDESKHSKRDMEFGSGRKDFRDESLASQGIHKALLGVTDSVDRAVNKEAMRQLWQLTLKPSALQVQEKLNQQLFKRYFPGYRCKFNFNDVDALKDNEESKLLQAKGLRELGYTINEINEKLDMGMEEITEPVGDMRLVPSNFIPVDDLYILDDNNSKIVSNSDKTMDKIVKILDEEETIEKSRSNRTSRNYVRLHNKLQRVIDRNIAKNIGRYFSKQLGKVIKILRKEGIDNTTVLLSMIHNLINEEKVLLMDTMRPVFKDGSAQAAKFAKQAINTDKGVEDEAYIDDVVESMTIGIAGINNNTYKLIRNQVKEGILAGESLDKIGKRITSIYKFNSSRVKLISRTESNMLIGRSTDAVYRANNIKKKEWVGNLDEATRDTHAENISIGPVPYDHVYSNGMSFPGDSGPASEVCNCRCTSIPIVE